jgi:hypothetical protein
MANRHDVIIWDADVYGAPDDYDLQTLAKAQTLIQQPAAEASKKLLAFARDVEQQSKSNDLPPIIARYLTNFEARVKTANTAAYCFNLPEYNWHSLVKILLKSAQKYGLVLLGEELVLLLLPNGLITPQHTENYWIPILEAPKRKDTFPEMLSEFYELFKTRVEELLSNHGFVLEEDDFIEDENEFYLDYIRQTPSGYHRITFGCEGGDGDFTLRHNFFQLHEEHMVKIAMQSDFQYSMRLGGGILLMIASVLGKSAFEVNNWESLEELLLIFKNSALKWSDSAQDIKGIDALLNGDFDSRVRQKVHQFTAMPYALIIARLANNPNFEELVVSLGESKSWPPVKSDDAWPKLVQYLRDEIKPLV